VETVELVTVPIPLGPQQLQLGCQEIMPVAVVLVVFLLVVAERRAAATVEVLTAMVLAQRLTQVPVVEVQAVVLVVVHQTVETVVPVL
jgi:hypothetical protein